MKLKYHISDSGEIVTCHASRIPCPKENFDTITKAEQSLSENYGGTIPKTVKRLTTALKDAENYYGGKYVTEYHMALPDGIEGVLDGIRDIGNPLIVGGTVRDSLSGHQSKDIDIEVHGVNIDTLTDHLRKTGYSVDEVGKQFGVLKIQKGSIKDLDISVPRRENKTGAGHRAFDISIDENMTVQEAAERRDFTFNAIMYDNKRNIIIDPTNGKQDYENRTMRHVSQKFQEDPLRVLRGFQFASRFNMEYAPETATMCKNLRKEYESLSIERVKEEWIKFFTKGTHPDKGIKALQDTGWDNTTPGLQEALKHENTTPSLQNLQKVSENKRIIMGAAIISQPMNKKDRLKFTQTAVNGSKEQTAARILAEFSEKEISTTYDRKIAALRLKNTGLTLTDIKDFASVTGAKECFKMANLAIDEGVGEKPEPDLINGMDILAKTNKEAGAWVGQVVSQVRDAQYRGELSNKSDALSYLDTLLSE